MRLIPHGFYRLRSGSVGRYLGVRSGLRAFSVKGRELLVKRRQVEALVVAPAPKVREVPPRRIPRRVESKVKASTRRSNWASQRAGRRASTKSGNAMSSGGVCRCGLCRIL